MSLVVVGGHSRNIGKTSVVAGLIEALPQYNWTAVGQLGNAAGVIREIVESSENSIVESNSVMQFWKPDLYIVVLDFETRDFKDSALRYLDRADCLVTVGNEKPEWSGVSRRLWESKPRYEGAELAQFVEG